MIYNLIHDEIWFRTSYKMDLIFGIVCLICQYACLVALIISYGTSALNITMSLSCGVGCLSMFARCKSMYQHWRNKILIATEWWKVKEFGGYI
jgi:hypothetical protein